MATANPDAIEAADDAPAATAATGDLESDPSASLKRVSVYVTDAQVSGIVDKTVLENKKKKTRYSFVVFVVWSDGHTTTIWRSYNQIFTFQVDLLGKYPEEAGEKANKDGRRKRVIPFLPGKKLFTRSDAKLASQREPQIADWMKKLVELPEKVSRSKFVVDFFHAREGDPGYQKEQEAGKAGDNSGDEDQSAAVPVYLAANEERVEARVGNDSSGVKVAVVYSNDAAADVVSSEREGDDEEDSTEPEIDKLKEPTTEAAPAAVEPEPQNEVASMATPAASEAQPAFSEPEAERPTTDDAEKAGDEPKATDDSVAATENTDEPHANSADDSVATTENRDEPPANAADDSAATE